MKKFDKFKSALEKILSSKYFLGSLIVMAIAFVMYRPAYEFSEIISYADRGKMLLHGIKTEAIGYRAISYSMPFISLLGAVAEYHSNINPQILLKIIFSFSIVGTYILSYMIGLNSKGRITALITVFIAGMYDNDFEQVIYSFFVILAAEMLILRSKNYNAKTSIMAGLAIGFGFFARPPLFLLPFLMIIFDYFYHAKNFKKYIVTSIIFLSASYILLLPWAGINYVLFNKFIPFEAERGAANIITSIKGVTFTMEGDARFLADLKETDSVYKWAAKELLKDPFPCLSAVPKRLLQVFYMHPFLILLSLIGFIIGRKNKNVLLISIMTGYFIIIHSLFPINERYFYPLKHLLAFPAACAFCFLFEKREKPSAARGLPYTFFYAALAIIIMMEAVLIAYPFRAKQELLAIDNSLQKFPNDRWLIKRKGEILLLKGNRHKEALQLLETAYKINPKREPSLGYILSTLKAKNTNEISNPPESFNCYELFLIKIAKELQLDGINTAKKSLLAACVQWNKENFLLKPTSKKDFKMVKKIQKTGMDLYNNLNIPQALYWWPNHERAKIISNLKKITTVPHIAISKLNRSELAAQHISAILKVVNKKTFNTDTYATSMPLVILDGIISGEIKKGNTKHLINTFHPTIGKISSEELEETIKLVENISNNDFLLKQIKKMSSLHACNILYEFINYRLSMSGLSDKEQKIILERENEQILKNIYALLKGSWYLADNNEPEKAKAFLKYALKIKNKTVDETMEICFIFQKLGEYKESLLILDELIKNEENNPQICNSRGVVLRFLGNKDLAIEDFKKALELNPLFYQAELNLASLYTLLNNKDLAAKHYSNIAARKDLPPEVIELAKKELSKIQK
ncbi:MAG: hypothetical protein L6420_01220 [Elusimicrobia bacterium]|nr:hypothetical protein [Elusimicrobiota bacterium]